MKDQGFRFVFDNQCYFQDKGNNDKFNFKFSNKYEVETAFSTVVNHSLLHSRFGHAGPRRLKKLSTRSTNFPSTNFTSFFHHDPTNCDACNSGGARKKPFPKRTTQKFTYFMWPISEIHPGFHLHFVRRRRIDQHFMGRIF